MYFYNQKDMPELVFIAQKYSAEILARSIKSPFPFLFALFGTEFMECIFGQKDIIASGQKTGLIRLPNRIHLLSTELS
jgi:hypothetical protein